MPTAETLKDIKELQQRCEEYEGISLKLNWDMLSQTSAFGDCESLVTYEDELLVGFLGLYNFGSEMEVCGMVRPGYRRRGIFTSLWNQAQTIIKRKNVSTLLLNAPAASSSGTAFLQSLPLHFHHAEYQMKWDEGSLSSAETSSATGTVLLRPAQADETHILIKLDCGGFDMTSEEAVKYYDLQNQEGAEEHIMIEMDGQPVGKMRLWTENNESWICGLTVNEKLRGQGIGRSALLQTIERERKNYNGVNLEVSLDNPNALKLYESCGFVVQNKQDYFQFIG